jgi:hypothetical protein
VHVGSANQFDERLLCVNPRSFLTPEQSQSSTAFIHSQRLFDVGVL